MRRMILAGAQNIHQVRRIIPARAVPRLVQARMEKLWADPDFRLGAEHEMRFLLGNTDRAAEIPTLARVYSEHMMTRAYLRWHPRAITKQRVEGIEWLTSDRDPDRSIVLSFMHHHRYDGMFGSLARLGARLHTLTMPQIIEPSAGIAFQQHLRVVARGSTIVPASGGSDAIAAMLKPGVTLAIASDVPGRTPVTFLGRRVLGSFGAARIATMTDSQVVLVTHRRDAAGPYVRVERPLEPQDYPDPGALLADMLDRHGQAVLDWPEALEAPTARWGALDS